MKAALVSSGKGAPHAHDLVYLRDNSPPDRDANAPADPGKLRNMAVTAGHGNGGTTPTKLDADRTLGVAADVVETARAGIASGP